MTKLTILLMLIAVAAVPIIASRLLPWWGGLLVLAVEMTIIFAFAPRVISSLVQHRLVKLFRDRSEALDGARVEVHEVCPIDREQFEPDEALKEGEGEASARHVMVDFTLMPAGEREYRPSEIGLVPVGTDEEEPANDVAAFALRVRLVSDEGEHECDQLTGPARLRIVFGIPAALTGRVRFRYFFVQFGELELP